jgi:excisionase family DNA binding protein
MTLERWMSVDQVSEYLGVSKDTVYAWITNKGMPGYKVGRFWKFKQADVDAWVRDGGAASSSDEEPIEAPDNE